MTTKKPYIKPTLSVQDQVKLLKNRGLEIPDETKAERYLLNISYYRLSGYMYLIRRHGFFLKFCQLGNCQFFSVIL
jgi:abortive infection bacteriophage resistance protein